MLHLSCSDTVATHYDSFLSTNANHSLPVITSMVPADPSTSHPHSGHKLFAKTNHWGVTVVSILFSQSEV